jgi:ADP-ribose pyrophosphatase YjhB (NUDIX family)
VRQPYKTARCILYRDREFLLAVHSGFWGARHRRWGLPGGQIEWGESPATAVARELEEELSVYVPDLMTIGPFSYKRSLHMVYAAEVREPIHDWDDSELLEIGWFSEKDIASLKADKALHADYELEAVRALMQKLGR